MFIIAVYLIFSMLAVIWFDMSRFTIPNWLVGSLLALYPVAIAMSSAQVDWKMALAGMGIVFAVGYVVFAMKWMGAGDIKLITVCALWAGWQELLDFVFLTAILGGVFAFTIWMLRKAQFWVPKQFRSDPMPRIMRVGEPIPYGVAIAFAMMIMLWMGLIPVIK